MATPQLREGPGELENRSCGERGAKFKGLVQISRGWPTKNVLGRGKYNVAVAAATIFQRHACTLYRRPCAVALATLLAGLLHEIGGGPPFFKVALTKNYENPKNWKRGNLGTA